FFSSRRRHTRSKRDWSSDVCSSDLTIRSNAQGSPQTVTLSGTGLGPVVSLSPPSLTFGTQLVGTASAAQAVTLHNTGNAPLYIRSEERRVGKAGLCAGAR